MLGAGNINRQVFLSGTSSCDTALCLCDNEARRFSLAKEALYQARSCQYIWHFKLKSGSVARRRKDRRRGGMGK